MTTNLVQPIASVLTAALDLAKRDPEAQRLHAAGRVARLDRAGDVAMARVVQRLAGAYGDHVAAAELRHGMADRLEARVEEAQAEGKTTLGLVPLRSVAQRAAERRKQARVEDGLARAALLAMLRLGITEEDLVVVARIHPGEP